MKGLAIIFSTVSLLIFSRAGFSSPLEEAISDEPVHAQVSKDGSLVLLGHAYTEGQFGEHVPATHYGPCGQKTIYLSSNMFIANETSPSLLALPLELKDRRSGDWNAKRLTLGGWYNW